MTPRSDAFGPTFDLPPISGTAAQSREMLAKALYGPIPSPPDEVEIESMPIRGESAKRLRLTIKVREKAFAVDTALWCPRKEGPVPVIVALDFLGPAGILKSGAYPRDQQARIYFKPDDGEAEFTLSDRLRGKGAYRWPIKRLNEAGFAVMVSCYGSWVPDDASVWQSHGLAPFLGTVESGAISLWAWALCRMVDAATKLPGIDAGNVIVAGHSRLGKAALWAAANDERISGVFANNPGCAGAALLRHGVGETLASLKAQFPHWLKSDAITDPDALSFDQHHLLASILPRKVYLGCAREDLWADPVGTYLALTSAAPRCTWPTSHSVWEAGGQVVRGPAGYHLREGAHEMLRADWEGLLGFLDTLDGVTLERGPV